MEGPMTTIVVWVAAAKLLLAIAELAIALNWL
jgi:hypothetical protein